MAGIGDRMSARNSTIVGKDGIMRYGDGTPVPLETRLRFESRRTGAWLPDDVADWPPEWRRRLEEADDAAV